MQLFHNFTKTPIHHGSVVTIGNFDGVHLGHQKLLTDLVTQAKAKQLSSVVIIFEPQPLEFFLHTERPVRITNLRNKLYQIAKFNVDYIVCLRFDKALSQLSAEEFTRIYLHDKLNIKYLIIGDDFTFGNKRHADFTDITSLGHKYNFAVSKHESFCIDNIRVSSTNIRDYLQNNDFKMAEKMLGRSYDIMGKIIHGNKLARVIGFPTANIALNKIKPPLSGVFISIVEVNQQQYYAIANIGIRPTINGSKVMLETHIFDFNQDIYGQCIRVRFIKKLRDEQKFADIAVLKQQIQHDVVVAKQYVTDLQ